MAKLALLQITANIQGDGVALSSSFTPWSSNASAAKQESVSWSAGNNNLVAPTNAKQLLIENLSAQITLKGAAGDTGLVFAAGSPAVIPVVAGTTYVVNSGGTSTADLTWL